MALTKQSWQNLPTGSPEQVVAHAAWRQSRGKDPSMTYGTIRNPRPALGVALLEAPPESRDDGEEGDEGYFG
jgi:hypothetical protein